MRTVIDIDLALRVATKPRAVVAGEDAVVWIRPFEEVAALRYVREIVLLSVSRTVVPVWREEGTLLGYATLGPRAQAAARGLWPRRCFWLHPLVDAADGPYAYLGLPLEAVAPASVKPGAWGVRPADADVGDVLGALGVGLMDRPATPTKRERQAHRRARPMVHRCYLTTSGRGVR